MNRKDLLLMSPAGSYESLMAAIQGGADAVYFGVEKLNMRSHSSYNYKLHDLPEIMNICNQHNIASYLTINTIIYDHEIELMHELVNQAKKCGVTAIIATDQATINYASEQNVEVHISTQLNISNIESLKFYAKFADVVVFARELDLNQISDLAKQIKTQNITGPSGNLIKPELFIHGALCMSISGKCYLSLHEYNYSANRGSCLQSCRRGYLVTDKENGYELEIDNQYIMSPRDLCTIHFLNKILDAGVSVLKIEGRARSPEYVKTVTKCYNEAIHAYLENDYTAEKIENWEKKLSTVFNRGFWEGYYLGQKLGEWSHVYGSQATKRKTYVAKGTNYFSNIKVAEFLLETGKLQINDEIIIMGPTTGVIQTRVKEIRVDKKSVDGVGKGKKFSIPVDQVVRRSDKLYKIVDADKVKKQ